MREIKFRVWDKENRKIGLWPEIKMMGFELIERLGPLMQYTGLKDKTGREIYEGDIIQECIIGERIWEETEDGGGIVEKCPTGKVEYIGYYFNVQPITKGRVRLKKGYSEVNISRYDGIFQWHLHPHDADYEVIGNIYENPELLK